MRRCCVWPNSAALRSCAARRCAGCDSTSSGFTARTATAGPLSAGHRVSRHRQARPARPRPATPRGWLARAEDVLRPRTGSARRAARLHRAAAVSRRLCRAATGGARSRGAVPAAAGRAISSGRRALGRTAGRSRRGSRRCCRAAWPARSRAWIGPWPSPARHTATCTAPSVTRRPACSGWATRPASFPRLPATAWPSRCIAPWPPRPPGSRRQCGRLPRKLRAPGRCAHAVRLADPFRLPHAGAATDGCRRLPRLAGNAGTCGFALSSGAAGLTGRAIGWKRQGHGQSPVGGRIRRRGAKELPLPLREGVGGRGRARNIFAA